MKLLVFGDRLEVGGSQVNAIELSSALRERHGYDILYYATPGPMQKLVHQKGLRFVPAPDAYRHPSRTRMHSLRDLVRRERPDVIQAWDWWQCLDAYWSVHLAMGIPMLVSDMNMTIGRVLPKAVLTTFGTPEMIDQARALGRRVELLLPPVDVHYNAPGTVDPQAFRETYGIGKDEILLVTVSRFAATLKAESLRRTIDAVGTVGREFPVRLALVGDGVLREELQQLANGVNTSLGRQAVLLTGSLLDPRPAYAAADIVIGMGGSGLRGMAFQKAVIIVGEQNFSGAFTPESASAFFYKGIFGVGKGHPGNTKLVADIRSLVEHPETLPSLGEFSRNFVVERYSLESQSDNLARYCEIARSQRRPIHVSFADCGRTMAVLVGGMAKHAMSWPPRLPPRRTVQT